MDDGNPLTGTLHCTLQALVKYYRYILSCLLNLVYHGAQIFRQCTPFEGTSGWECKFTKLKNSLVHARHCVDNSELIWWLPCVERVVSHSPCCALLGHCVVVEEVSKCRREPAWTSSVCAVVCIYQLAIFSSHSLFQTWQKCSSAMFSVHSVRNQLVNLERLRCSGWFAIIGASARHDFQCFDTVGKDIWPKNRPAQLSWKILFLRTGRERE